VLRSEGEFVFDLVIWCFPTTEYNNTAHHSLTHRLVKQHRTNEASLASASSEKACVPNKYTAESLWKVVIGVLN